MSRSSLTTLLCSFLNITVSNSLSASDEKFNKTFPARRHYDFCCRAGFRPGLRLKLVIDKGLSRNVLDDYIRSDYYNVSGKALTNFQEKLSVTQGKLAQELLKSNYDLGFVILPEEYDENDLEDVLEQRMTRFLLELGEGWAFAGRQKEIIISGKTRKIDLLFYHIYLRCYVVLELKVKPFDPEFAGKLNFYVNAVNEFVKRDSDNPTIGL